MPILYVSAFDTPLGPLLGVASNFGLSGLEFAGDRLTLLSRRLRHWYPNPCLKTESFGILKDTQFWLRKYFSGHFELLNDVPLDLKGSQFERAIWSILRTLSPGQTLSYTEVALRMQRPESVRAVASAIGRNPISLLVPCHRVIGKTGALTGYGGGLDRKAWLLHHESGYRLHDYHSTEKVHVSTRDRGDKV